MTKLEKFTTKRGERYISQDGGKAFILKAGCQVFKMGNETNIPTEQVRLRKKSVGADGKTNKDLSFKSLSAMAKFIAGYSVSGNAYFKGAVKDGAEEESAATATTATTTKEAKASSKSAKKAPTATKASVTEVTEKPTTATKGRSSKMKAKKASCVYTRDGKAYEVESVTYGGAVINVNGTSITDEAVMAEVTKSPYPHGNGFAVFVEGDELGFDTFEDAYVFATTSQKDGFRLESEEAPKAEEPKADRKASSKMKGEYPTLTKAQAKANDALAQEIMNFLVESTYKIDPRSINTLKFVDNPNEFILNSMELIGIDQRFVEELRKKFVNPEWKALMKRLKDAPTSHGQINRRLEIFYGPAGTGKTTRATTENPTANVLAASAGFDPDDLFTRIDPATKSWVKTDLALAMEHGQPIVIDEINQYNEVVMARLQAVTDNKTSIVDRGITIHIADGFKVIGTMNLETNVGGKKPLPDPLVSRCYNIAKMDKPYLGWVF